MARFGRAGPSGRSPQRGVLQVWLRERALKARNRAMTGASAPCFDEDAGFKGPWTVWQSLAPTRSGPGRSGFLSTKVPRRKQQRASSPKPGSSGRPCPVNISNDGSELRAGPTRDPLIHPPAPHGSRSVPRSSSFRRPRWPKSGRDRLGEIGPNSAGRVPICAGFGRTCPELG